MRRYLLPALVLLLIVPAAPAAAAKKVRKGPSGTAFYTPPSKLPGSKHGAAIWARKLTGAAALKSAKSNRLLLYRSVRADGSATAVSGVVSIPKGKAPKKGWPVITYAHGTTGIADQCAPSRDSSVRRRAHAQLLRLPAAQPLAEGGLRGRAHGLHRPRHAGRALLSQRDRGGPLDARHRARGQALDKRLDIKRVLISGHSQGGHAALWAASLAPKWTPDVKVRGTVAFAPASHIADQAGLLRSVNTPIPGLDAIVGLITRSIDTPLPQLGLAGGLGPEAAAVYPQTLTECYSELDEPSSWGAIPLSSIFRCRL